MAVLSLVLGASALADAPGSVLGLEPGKLRLCNDDLGVILWGPDASPTLSSGKSDVWDRRNPKSPERVLTLSEMMAMAKAGDPTILNGAAYYTAYNLHDFPCPKPVGQVILGMKFLESDGTLRFEELPHAVSLHAVRGTKRLDLRIFVSAVRNVISIAGTASGLEPDDFTLRVYRHRDTIVPGGELHPTLGGKVSPKDFDVLPMPRAGAAATECPKGQSMPVAWVAQDFPADPTFPDGFTSVLAACMTGTARTPETVEGATGLGTPMIAPQEGRISHGLTKRFTPINQAPGSAATLHTGALDGAFGVFITATTTQDNPDPLAWARTTLADAAARGDEALWAEHEAQWTAYDARPCAKAWREESDKKVGLFEARWGGLPYKARPFGYYGDIPLCSVDSTKFCDQDSSMWHADFHFNEIGATGPCMYRQFDLVDAYVNMIQALLPMAQANARDVYGCGGAMYPLTHYPLKADTIIHAHITWEQSMEITALVMRPAWQRFLYSWDVPFLREKVYPLLCEGARFYADFLKPGEDGLYHVFPTVSPEHRGLTKDLAMNHDSQSGITLIRYHLRAAAQAADLLGLDATEAAHWKHIAGHMPPYPTIDSPEGPIFTDVTGGEPIEFNIPVPLSAVFWGDDIGLDSPAEQLDIARRTLRAINVWEPHRGYLAGVRARLGVYDPKDSIREENLLQSYTGTLRVFPATPPDFAGGFENLGAQGAFVVSANRSSMDVAYVQIESLAGNPCQLANPWGDRPAEITDATGNTGPAILQGPALRFPTAPNHEYTIRPTSL
ncbi:MAG: hypothetical protein NTU83_08335 [Candidatus Hydrogenedentes bacterium]|nr:hypothetical protein [Candidatus Hydrogenedentota bacterium]